MRPLLISLAVGLVLLGETSRSEAAPEYLFCLAADYKAHIVYITNVFHSTMERERLQAALRVHLTSLRHGFDVIQCPQPTNLPEANDALTTAEEFNKKNGFRIVDIPITNN